MKTRIVRVQAWIRTAYDRIPPRARVAFQRTFTVVALGLIGFVLYRQLRGTDWPAVLQSLPVSPWFYLLFFVRFINLPIIDTLCYSAVFATNLFRYFGTFLMKFMLNMAVAGSSGDLYFLFWAVRTLGISYRRAFSAVKDVSLLSAAASNTVAFIVLGAYFAFGDLSLTNSVSPGTMTAIIAVVLVGVLVSLLLVLFRGKVLAVGTSVMWRIIGYHMIRSAGDLVLLGFQWTVGLPGTTFGDWINLLVIALLVGRVPGIPARDLVFLTLALALGESVDADRAAVTALFLTDTALRQVAFATSFAIGAAWRSRSQPLPLDRPDDPEVEPEPKDP